MRRSSYFSMRLRERKLLNYFVFFHSSFPMITSRIRELIFCLIASIAELIRLMNCRVFCKYFKYRS